MFVMIIAMFVLMFFTLISIVISNLFSNGWIDGDQLIDEELFFISLASRLKNTDLFVDRKFRYFT